MTVGEFAAGSQRGHGGGERLTPRPKSGQDGSAPGGTSCREGCSPRRSRRARTRTWIATTGRAWTTPARADVRAGLDVETHLRLEKVWVVHSGQPLGPDSPEVEAHAQGLVAAARPCLLDRSARDVHLPRVELARARVPQLARSALLLGGRRVAPDRVEIA